MHVPTSENGRYRSLVRVYTTSISYMYEIAFSAGLNGLQVDQVGKEKMNELLLTPQLVPYKLVAACKGNNQPLVWLIFSQTVAFLNYA